MFAIASSMIPFIVFAGSTTQILGQSSAPFANCIQMKIDDSFVQLVTDEDCNEQQFAQAVAYYKANVILLNQHTWTWLVQS
jgi:hypothetical protein